MAKKKSKRGKSARIPGATYRSALTRSRTALKKMHLNLLREMHEIQGDPRSTQETRDKMYALYTVVLGARYGLEVK